MIDHTFAILGVRVAQIDGEGLLREFDGTIARNERNVFAYVNAHALMLARALPWFKASLNNSSATYPDGEGVRLAARILGGSLPPTTALTRWIWDVASYCERNGRRLFLLGSTDEYSCRAAAMLQKRFPRLNVTWHHGYFADGDDETVLEAIRAFAPHVLLVGLGMPKQEAWIDRYRNYITANVILPAGGAIEYAAGIRPPCPRWISRLGMEWLFRMAYEPRRLFRRYAFGNIVFLSSVIAERLSRRRAPGPALRRDGRA
jgi:N-acetylglucosaminyldiphosphoundecaprenol N-acetyl-beta-D-mannosaminyltransferase